MLIESPVAHNIGRASAKRFQTTIILLIVYTKTLFRCEWTDQNIRLQLAKLKTASH